MIRFITGAPGAGKSLYVLDVFVNRRKEYGLEGREVLWCGFDFGDRKPPFGRVVDVDVIRDWSSQKDGTVFVVDEAQKLFSSYKGERHESWTSGLTEHRHRGFDFFLLTQDVQFLPKPLHKLVGEHVWLVRKTKTSSYCYSWSDGVHYIIQYLDRQTHRSVFVFDKRLYSLYESASLHTKQAPRMLPIVRRLIFLLLAGVVFLVLGVWYAIWSWSGGVDERKAELKSESVDVVRSPRFPVLDLGAGVHQLRTVGCMGDECWVSGIRDGVVMRTGSLGSFYPRYRFVGLGDGVMIIEKGKDKSWWIPFRWGYDDVDYEVVYDDGTDDVVVSDDVDVGRGDFFRGGGDE